MPKGPTDASYEDFAARWERGKARRLGRGKPGDMDYRPPLIGSPRPHKTKAADFLGINRNTLNKKVKDLNIDASD